MTRPPFILEVALPDCAGDAAIEVRSPGERRDPEPLVIARRQRAWIDAGWPAELSWATVEIEGVAVEHRLLIRVDLAGWPTDVLLRAGDAETRDAAADAVWQAVLAARVKQVTPACAADFLHWFPQTSETPCTRT